MKKHRYTVVIDGKEAYWGIIFLTSKNKPTLISNISVPFLQRLCVTTRSIAREPMIPNGIDLQHLTK